MDVWARICSSIIALDIAANEELYLSVTGSRYLLTDLEYPDQTWHKGFEVRNGESPSFLVLVPGSEALCLVLRPALPT